MPVLSSDRVRRQHATGLLEADRPLVLVSKTEGTQRVMAADHAARRCGLTVGMALAQARAMVPGVCVVPHDATADERLLEAIADWADRYTPMVGRDPPHGLVLDITGAAHLLGGESALRADLLGRLARQGLDAIAATAPTVGAAWALSRTADSKENWQVAETISQAGLDAVLSLLPVSALRLQPDTIAALRRVGLKRIGDLIGRPRGSLAARFGAPLIVRLDQARGIDTEAISPRQPVPPAMVEHGFAEPILATSAVEGTCRLLADQLCEKLVDRGQGATALQLAVYRVDGLVKRIDLRLASPCRHAKTMADLLALRLGHLDDPLDPGFGYDLIRLSAGTVVAKAEETAEFDGFDVGSAPVHLAHATAALIDRLAARFGEAQIHKLASVDTHIPEQACRLVPAVGGRGGAMRNAVSGEPRQRPLRLLDPPEPVEVMAEVPDGPPIHLRWRRRPQRIVQAQGPERIAGEWWRAANLAGVCLDNAERTTASLEAGTRDYWRIEDASGRRLWLYREGFYGGHGRSEGRAGARWYVHGLFA